MSKKKSRIYISQVEKLRNKLGDSDYCLGIDPGVGSIGIAAIKLEKFANRQLPTTVIYSGSRIFKSSEGAAERRLKRGERNSHRHNKNRLRMVWKLLAEKGLMLPFSREDVPDPAVLRFDEETRRKDPYELRLRGLSEKLSLSELGYALYHIANHRGSSSVRSLAEESDDKKYEAGKQKTAELIKTTGVKTFIEVLNKYNEGKESALFRNKKDYESYTIPIPTRDLIKNELNRLLETQAKYNEAVLDEEYVNRIKSAILFENEMLVPEAGNCPYFKDEKKLPAMAFINEERRILEALNNVRYSIVELDGTINDNKKLTDEERQILFDQLMTGKDVSEAGFKKLLNLASATNIKLQGTTAKTQSLKGFKYPKLKVNPFLGIMDLSLQNEVLSKWVNSPSEEIFINYLKEQLGATKDEIEVLMRDLRLEASSSIGAYAPCGQSAMEIFMPYIRNERLSFHEAVTAAIMNGQILNFEVARDLDSLPYYGKVLPDAAVMLMGKAWHSAFEEKIMSAGFHKQNTNSDEENYGRIANPVVHQTLNELRKYVNELIEIFGKKPSYITIEVGRELKLGKEKRDLLSKDNAKEEKENKRIFDTYCKNIDNGSRLIKKFKLLERQKFVCPYCLERINVDDVITGKVDYEHVFPESDVPGSPMSNLVIAHGKCNAYKGKRIPSEAFGSSEKWPAIIHNLEENENMKGMVKKFQMSRVDYEKWKNTQGMLSRFKSDNSYAATLIREYLSCLYSDEEVLHGVVRTIKGQETAILRKAWGLQGLSAELGDAHLSTEEQKEYSGEKVRSDNRHHALDAIVIGYCTRGMIKNINTLSARNYSDSTIQDMIQIPRQFTNSNLDYESQKKQFRQEIRGKLFNETFCSRKIDHSMNGELLKGTNYSLYTTNGKEVVYGVVKRVKNVTSSQIDGSKSGCLFSDLYANYSIPKWVKSPEKEKLESFIEHNRNIYELVRSNLSRAEKQLKAESEANIKIGKKAINITEKNIIAKALSLTGGKYYAIKNSMASKLFIKKRSVGNSMVIDTGANHCIDLYHDKEGKLRAEVIRKIDIVNKNFKPDYIKDGFSLYCRIFPYDILEIDMSDSVDKIKPDNIFVPNAATKRTFVVITTFTSKANGNVIIMYDSILSSNPGKAGSFYAETSMKLKHPRLVKLSPSGLVKYASPIFSDKPCGE